MQKKSALALKIIFSFAAVCLFVGGGQAIPQAQELPVSLTQDSRLLKTVSISYQITSLKKLCGLLSSKSCNFTSVPDSSEIRVQLQVHDVSLLSVLQATEELLGGRWLPLKDNSGYEFAQTPQTRRYRSAWWELYNGERERILSEQQNHIRESIFAAERPNNLPDIEGSNPEGSRQLQVAKELFAGLPPSVFAQVLSNIDDTPFLNVLNANAIGFGSDNDAESVPIPFGTAPASTQEFFRKKVRENLYAEANFLHQETPILLTNGGFVLFIALPLPNSQGYDTLSLPVPMPDVSALILDHRWLPDEIKRRQGNVPDSWKKLAAYQKTRVWKNINVDTAKITHEPRLRSDVLSALARGSEINYIADAHSISGVPLSNGTVIVKKQSKEIAVELDAMAEESDSSWKQRADGLYLVRNNRWYRDDIREVPDALLKKWSARISAIQNQPIDAGNERWKPMVDLLAEMSQLSKWQITGGLKWTLSTVRPEPKKVTSFSSDGEVKTQMFTDPTESFPFATAARVLLEQRRLYRFYNSLSEGQRKFLFAGHLTPAGMTTEQIKQVRSLLPALYNLNVNTRISLGIAPNIKLPENFPAAVPISFHLTFQVE